MAWIQTFDRLYQTQQIASLSSDSQGRVVVSSASGVTAPLTGPLTSEHRTRVFNQIADDLRRNLTLIDVPSIEAATKDSA